MPNDHASRRERRQRLVRQRKLSDKELRRRANRAAELTATYDEQKGHADDPRH